MRTIVLLAKAYGKKRKQLIDLVQSEISTIIEELDAELVNFSTDKRGHFIVRIQGQDSEFVFNILAKNYGSSISFDRITEGKIFKGFLVDVGKVGYGRYVDIAITNHTRTDVLIPLHRIRSQFGLNRPLRFLVDSLVLVDNLPVEVKITSIDKHNEKLEAEFGLETLTRFEQWMHDDHERLLVFGANSTIIDNALRKSGHLEDIYEIENLGIFEYALVCKRSTRASGILAAIGPRLQGIPMHLFIPKEIEAKLNA